MIDGDALLAATQVDLFWLPEAVTRLDRPDVLALHDGGTRDLHNQVIRTSTSEDALPALIEEIQRFHTSVSQWLVVPPFMGSQLEKLLPAHGYAPRFEGDAFTLPSSTRFAEGAVEVVEVHDLATIADNISVCERAFDKTIEGVDLARELALCTGPQRRTARFVAYLDGEPVGSANINRYPDFGFLWAGGVHPDHRGRGVYRALLGARCRWAEREGIGHVGLYANRKTSGPVVAGLGFDRHGPMAYFWRPAPCSD